MKRIQFCTRRALSRRSFLRGAGAALALPLLDAMVPAFARGEEREPSPRRMIAICNDLGFMPEFFFPEREGAEYELSPYLQVIGEHRGDFTVFSGVSHPDVKGGHSTDICFLTAAPEPLKAGFRNSISLDQAAAESLGRQTRFPTLSLRVGPGDKSLSYTSDGARLPAEERPSEVYKRLFLQGSPQEVAAQVQRLRDGRSLMDSLSGRIQSLRRQVGTGDRERLDQFFNSVRDVEKRLVANEEWEQRPAPRVDVPLPEDNLEPGALIERTRAIYDLARLALETDSTRFVTIIITQGFNPRVDLPGVTVPHHALTHQTSIRESREQLRIVEEAQLRVFGELLDGLKHVREEQGTLLDRTMVLHGSNLGHASLHDTRNLPIILAGGGFRHGRHLAFDKDDNAPLPNLYVSMLQRLGLETDRFATSTGTIDGLELT